MKSSRRRAAYAAHRAARRRAAPRRGLISGFYATLVFTQFCRLFFIFWCAIIVLKLVVGNEKIYKLKNGKEPDPRERIKAWFFINFGPIKKVSEIQRGQKVV